MKNFLICFLALSNLSFANITTPEQIQNIDITKAAKQEKIKALHNIDHPNTKHPVEQIQNNDKIAKEKIKALHNIDHPNTKQPVEQIQNNDKTAKEKIKALHNIDHPNTKHPVEQIQNNDKTAKEKIKALHNIDHPNTKQQVNAKNKCSICPIQEPVCEPSPCCCKDPCCRNSYVSIALKGSYFLPQGEVYRHLYGGGFSPLIETTFILYRWINLFIEAGYYHKDNYVKSVNLWLDSKVTTVPVSLGLNFTWRLTSCIDLYFKAGPNWVYTKTWIEIPDFKHVAKKNTFGGTFGSGIKFYVTKYIFLEVFANYLYDKKKIHDKDSSEKFSRQLGGIQAGGGLGFRF